MTEPMAPIPSPEPIALPGPEPLLHVLLVAGFLFHAIFMNIVLGGTPIMVLTEWIAQRTQNLHFVRLGKTLAALLPGAMALAVVLGVAPLLFVQILYGQLMYTAAILIGNVWAMVIVMLIVGYYGLYLFKYGRSLLRDWPRLRLAIGIVSAAMFLCTALVFVTMSVLMLNPERWLAVHAHGFIEALAVPSILPRYLHMVLAATAGAGMVLILYGVVLQSPWRSRIKSLGETPPNYGAWVVRYGAGWALVGTLPQIVVGPWLLMSLPPAVRGVLIDGGSTPSIVFFTALTFALLALVLLNASIIAPQARAFAAGGVASLAVTMSLMAVVRDRVRALWLTPHFDTTTLPVSPQWGFIALFAVFLLFAVVLISYLVRSYIRSSPLQHEDTSI